jgi:hypothetical protein
MNRPLISAVALASLILATAAWLLFAENTAGVEVRNVSGHTALSVVVSACGHVSAPFDLRTGEVRAIAVPVKCEGSLRLQGTRADGSAIRGEGGYLTTGFDYAYLIELRQDGSVSIEGAPK